MTLADQLDEPGAAGRRVAAGDEMLDGGAKPRRNRGRLQPEIGKAGDLALAHGNAAENLRQIFAGADAHQKLLGVAEIAGRGEPLRIGCQLAHRFDIGREPSEAVGGALLAIEQPRNRATLDRHPVGDGAAGVGEQRLDGGDRVAKRGDHVVAGGSVGGGKRHDWLRRPGYGPDGAGSLRVRCTKANRTVIAAARAAPHPGMTQCDGDSCTILTILRCADGECRVAVRGLPGVRVTPGPSSLAST